MIQFENAVKYFRNVILTELTTQDIDCWIAGGAVRDYFMSQQVKTDFDVFFPDEENFIKTKIYLETHGGETVWESDWGCKLKYKKRTFDLIKRYFDSPTECINEFDFTVSMFAVDNMNVFHGESSFIDLSKKQLMFNKITYPASTLKRSFRYYQKGFSMCLGEMKKLLESIQQTPVPQPVQETDSSGDEIKPDDNPFQQITTGQNTVTPSSFDDPLWVGID